MVNRVIKFFKNFFKEDETLYKNVDATLKSAADLTERCKSLGLKPG